MKTNEITNNADVIDSRDIIARIEELEEEEQSLLDNIEDFEGNFNEEEQEDLELAKQELEEFENDYGEELKTLKSLAEQCEGYGDWEYGEALIRKSYFEEYCEDLCEDIGDIPKDLPHYIVIDWEATARNIQQDYMTVDFDGVDYLMRSC